MRSCWHNNLDILGLVHVYTSLPYNFSELLEGLYCLVPKHNYVFTCRHAGFYKPRGLGIYTIFNTFNQRDNTCMCAAFKTQKKHGRWEFPSIGFATSKESTVLPSLPSLLPRKWHRNIYNSISYRLYIKGPGTCYWCTWLRISHRLALMNLLKLRSHRYLARS